MAYIGNSPGNIQRGRRAVYEFTATNAQTVFSGADDNGISLDLQDSNENDVYLNGSRLIFNDDYTIAGEVLTLTAAAAAGDILVIVTQDDIANVASYTKAEADARYINYDGDIVNGDIQVVGNITTDGLSVDSGSITIATSGTNTLTSNGTLRFDIDHDNNATDNRYHFTKNGGTGTVLEAREDGDVKFFDASGTNAKFYWDASVESLGIGDAAISNKLTLSDTADLGIQLTKIGSHSASIKAVSGGALTFGIDGSIGSTERMRIDSSGNVGIGTETPDNAKLEIAKGGSDTVGDGHIGFASGSDPLWAIRYGALDFDMRIDRSYAGWQSTPAVSIRRMNGNVGIGLDTASTKLHVKSGGSGNSNGSLYLEVDTPTNYPAMVIQTSTGGNGTETHGLYIKNTAAGHGLRIDDVASDTTPFVVDNGGKVGIGTSTPNHELTIGQYNTGTTSKPQGEQKLLHMDDSYVLRTARAHQTGDISSTGWYNVAKIPPFGSSGKVTVSLGGDFTADVVVITWISSHNTALNNGMGQPQLSAQASFAHTAWNGSPRISNTRMARDSTTGTYYIQVYVSAGVNNNTEGKSVLEVYQGSYVEGNASNIECMFSYYSGSPSHYFECPIVLNGTGYTGVHVRHEQVAFNITPAAGTTAITQNSTWQKLSFNSERYDIGNWWDSSTNRFTVGHTGKYLVGVNLQIENATGIVWTYLVPLVNGNTSVTNGNNFADFTPSGTYYNHNATWLMNLSKGDYLEFHTIGSGGSFNLKGGTESAAYVYLL